MFHSSAAEHEKALILRGVCPRDLKEIRHYRLVLLLLFSSNPFGIIAIYSFSKVIIKFYLPGPSGIHTRTIQK